MAETDEGDLRERALALLEWYALAGVDEAIDETPHDRFAESAAAEARKAAALADADVAAAPARPAPRPPATTSPAGATGDARALAAAAATLDELEAAVTRFTGCPLKPTARNTCFADGNPAGGIMLIGEAPGRDEDIQGKPFVGRAGRLLDKMLAAIGIDRTSAYITNIVFWRPPGNRTPTPAEAESCRPFTDRQIELVDPKLIVLLGNAAAKQMLGRTDGIMRLRGKWMTCRSGGKEIPAIATLHPAFLLRQPQNKRLAWQDFLEIRAKLEELGLLDPLVMRHQ